MSAQKRSFRADEHYEVHRVGARDEYISQLSCKLCDDFAVYRSQVPQPRGSKSGIGRYNLMRAAMVRHLTEKHPGSATVRDTDKYGDAP